MINHLILLTFCSWIYSTHSTINLPKFTTPRANTNPLCWLELYSFTTFDEHVTFSDQMLSIYKSSSSHIREIHCICPCLAWLRNSLHFNPNLTTIILCIPSSIIWNKPALIEDSEYSLARVPFSKQAGKNGVDIATAKWVIKSHYSLKITYIIFFC